MTVKLELTEQELATVNNALNEICNVDHIADWEFRTRMGVDREEVRRLLDKVNLILRRLHPPTSLELAVLSEIVKLLPPSDQAALVAQMEDLEVTKRENTGAGFFTYFYAERAATNPIQSDPRDCYVEAKIHGLETHLGFILWTKDGRVDFLEGYTTGGGDTLGIDLTCLAFEIVPDAKLLRLRE